MLDIKDALTKLRGFHQVNPRLDGTDLGAIARLSQLIARPLPELHECLAALPGCSCVPFSSSCDHFLNAEHSLEILSSFPQWASRHFSPIAGDGCGNYYVADLSREASAPIYFFDAHESDELPSYIVASDLSYFIKSVFKQINWFDRKAMLNNDPKLASGAWTCPLPWEAS